MIKFEFSFDGVNYEDIDFAKCTDVVKMSPVIDYSNIENEFSDGERETNNVIFKPFDIVVDFSIFYKNEFQRNLFESEFYSFLSKRKSYYITYEYSPGKRYQVQVSDIETEEKLRDVTIYKVTFKVFKAMSESIETTLNEQDITNQSWQYSQGLLLQDYKYQFQNNQFSIFNIGDFTIDPRKKHDLKIKLTGRSEGDVTICNQTTGERFIFKDKINKEQKDELTIEGIHCYKNGVVRNVDTNGELITLNPGENKFIIENVSQVKISFDTRFLYKT